MVSRFLITAHNQICEVQCKAIALMKLYQSYIHTCLMKVHEAYIKQYKLSWGITNQLLGGC